MSARRGCGSLALRGGRGASPIPDRGKSMDAPLTIQRLTHSLEKTFDGQIDMSDVVNEPMEQRRAKWLSRAVAAYAVMSLTGAEAAMAGASVTDCYHDQGIDAVYFSAPDNSLYLVQSKWHQSGSGSLALGEAHKFLDGVKAIIGGTYGGFDDKIKKREIEIQGVLMRSDVRIILVVAHTGKDPLGAEVEAPLRRYIKDQNNVGDEEVFSLETFDLGRIYASLRRAPGRSIDLDVILTEWATVGSPSRAYYGQVKVSEIATWAQYGRQLFDRNLRFYRGLTEVNESIEDSLASAPDRFWYLNNGITVLCTKLVKKHANGDKRDWGIFECSGVSVVNGAQTVGVIWEMARKTQDVHKDSVATVQARFISLENCPEGFDRNLTKATNTQNRIENRDFAALDDLQHVLAQEMALDNRRYAFKTGDPDPKNDEGCSVEEAAIALACAENDVGMAVLAKREAGALWRDTAKPPYTVFFNDKTTARNVWRSVLVMRAVNDELEKCDKKAVPRGELVAVHGNRFILHRVFRHPKILSFRDPKVREDELSTLARDVTREVFAKVAGAVQAKHSSAYPANLFKNASKCKDLLELPTLPPGSLFGWDKDAELVPKE